MIDVASMTRLQTIWPKPQHSLCTCLSQKFMSQCRGEGAPSPCGCQWPNTTHPLKHTATTVKYINGGIKKQGSIYSSSPRRLVSVEGRVNEKYMKLLVENVIYSAKKLTVGKKNLSCRKTMTTIIKPNLLKAFSSLHSLRPWFCLF